MEENFATQLVREPAKGRHLLDLLLVKREGLEGDAGHQAHRDHKFLDK